VLLVEDNEMNQELARELLEQAGIRVVLAGNGQEALDILAADRAFDGVLMDCQMPVMDGYTASLAIRADAALAHLPVIAMTANAMAGDRDKVLAAGMNDHIPKPLRVAEMFATIARWVVPGDTGPADALPAAATAEAAELGPLQGIDTRIGLATTSGNAALYQRLLRRFHDGNADFEVQFRNAQGGQDAAAAARMAHTLKGTAGTIGATAVQAAAARLEHACAEGHAAQEIDVALQAVLDALSPVLAGLSLHIGADQHDPAPAPIAAPTEAAPAADPRQLLHRLRTLLADDDADATDVFDQLRRQSRGSVLAAALAPIGRDLERYLFADALAKVDAILLGVATEP
jgi:CheY-like chemotaxis protein